MQDFEHLHSTKINYMKKIIIKNGLIAGLIVAAFMAYSTHSLLKNPESFEPSYVVGFTGMILAFIFIFVGIKQYRDQVKSGEITFIEGFKIGALIAIIASSIYVGVWLIEYYFFFPDFMDKYSSFAIKEAQSSNLNAAEIKEEIDSINSMRESYKNPIMVILWTYMEILPIGILVTLICALILKRKKA